MGVQISCVRGSAPSHPSGVQPRPSAAPRTGDGRWDRVHPSSSDPLAVALDLERRHRARLATLAGTDPVTGLPGRLAMENLLEVAAWNARAGGEVLGVLAVDLSGVDGLVDRFGAAAADDVLRGAAQRLRGCLRHGDPVGRIGGARLAVGLPGLATATARGETARIAGVLADAVRSPFVVAGELVTLGVRVGSALCPTDADDVAGLLGIAVADGGGARR